MKSVLFADSHLGAPGDPEDARLGAWIDGLGAVDLFVLGDLFDPGWALGPGDAERPTCRALGRLRERGGRAVFVPGNRDFAAAPFLRDRLGIDVAGPHLVVAGGLRLFVAHGDEADRSLGYRFARAAFRGRAFALSMRLLGPGGARTVAAALGRASRAVPADPGRLLRAQREWAQARLAEGAEVVALGHSHALGRVDLPGGVLLHLGDPARHRSWAEVEDGQARLLQAGEAGPVEVRGAPA